MTPPSRERRSDAPQVIADTLRELTAVTHVDDVERIFYDDIQRERTVAGHRIFHDYSTVLIELEAH